MSLTNIKIHIARHQDCIMQHGVLYEEHACKTNTFQGLILFKKCSEEDSLGRFSPRTHLIKLFITLDACVLYCNFSRQYDNFS